MQGNMGVDTIGCGANCGGHGGNDFTKPYLSHSEAAAYLGVAESTLYGWVSQGKIIPLKVGGLNRYRRVDLDRFLEECTQEAMHKKTSRRSSRKTH